MKETPNQSDLTRCSDADLERIAQALLLHAAMHLPLQEKGRECLKLVREDAAFRARMEEALTRLSQENEHGIQRMSPEQAELVRHLFAPVHV